MAYDAYGVAVDDPRGATVTGGLPYFGGPGNSYTLHAIATMVERLRDAGGRNETGVVNGMGWYAPEHSVGVYGTPPGSSGWTRGDTTAAQAQIDATAMPVILEVPEHGEVATVDASTVNYDAAGQVVDAALVGTLGEG